MAFNVKATLQAIQSYAQASGYFSVVQIGEPKQPPVSLTVAIFMRSDRVISITLPGNTIEQHVVTLRIYRDMLEDPAEEAEYELGEIAQKVRDDLIGEYDLGATIRNVDYAGIHGQAMGSEWGYVEVSQKMYRIVDITIPLEVDGSKAAAA